MTVLISVRQKTLLPQLREFLMSQGHRVLETETTAEALQVLNQSWNGVDLLLTDVSVQDASALIRSGLKVLLISIDPDFVNRALIPECSVAFIEKPFAWRDLTNRIGELMGAQAASPAHTASFVF